MKTVFDNSMVAHIWAQNTQPYGTSNNGSFHFDGNILYSYGSHFVVGVIHKGTVFLNSDTYSITTSKHQNHARNATTNPVYVPDLTSIARYLAAPTFNRDIVRQKVKAHLVKHALDMPDRPDILKILTHIGQPKSFSSIMRKATIRQSKANKLKSKRHITSLKISYDKVMATKLPTRLKLSNCRFDFREISTHALTAKRYIKLVKVAKRNATHVFKFRQAILGEIIRRDDLRNRFEHTQNIKYLFEFIRKSDVTPSIHMSRTYLDTYKVLKQRYPSLITSKMQALETQSLKYIAGLKLAMKLEDEIRARERFEKEKQKRIDWLNGTHTGYIYLTDEQGGALLRVKDNILETSQGAKVPLEHAVKAFKAVKAVRDHGLTWKRNGSTLRVGHFQIDTINSDGSIRVGCHKINWPEIKRIATELNI